MNPRLLAHFLVFISLAYLLSRLFLWAVFLAYVLHVQRQSCIRGLRRTLETWSRREEEGGVDGWTPAAAIQRTGTRRKRRSAAGTARGILYFASAQCSARNELGRVEAYPAKSPKLIVAVGAIHMQLLRAEDISLNRTNTRTHMPGNARRENASLPQKNQIFVVVTFVHITFGPILIHIK